LDNAIADLDNVIKLTPSDGRAYINRASIWIEKGKIDRAIEDNSEAIRLDPNNATTYTTRGEAFRLKGDLDLALADHEKAINLNSDLVEAYNNRAHVWRDKKGFDRGTADYDEAIFRNPQYAQAYAGRGEIRRLKGDLDQSLNDLNKAIEFGGRNPAFLYQRGETLRDKDELERAIADFDEVIHLLPEAVAAYTGRGLAYEKRDDLTKARADFQQALRLPPVPDAETAKPAQDIARSHLSALAEKERAAALAQKVASSVKLDQTGSLPSEPSFVLSFQDSLPSDVTTSSSITLNGVAYTVADIDPGSKSVRFLGPEGQIWQGLNYIRNAPYWLEGHQLQAFAKPYKSSYAIIAAIDDYDKLPNGSTQYPKLDHMVDRAKELKAVLLNLGFPRENIRTFFNQEATTDNLNRALYDFWKGGQFEGAGRLFFYFGGHGDGDGSNGYLVTYDFDPKRPTASGFLMSDIVSKHFQYATVHHFLVALDACSAGLAVPGMKSLGEDAPPTTRSLVQIKSAVEQRARNLLVAGTSSERALAPEGGLFTRVLIQALNGGADLLKNGVIQFDELAFYVKSEVLIEAQSMHQHQLPDSYKARGLGDGDVVFLRPFKN
jgi:tetratricopeptide (TPR) repeat protein